MRGENGQGRECLDLFVLLEFAAARVNRNSAIGKVSAARRLPPSGRSEQGNNLEIQQNWLKGMGG